MTKKIIEQPIVLGEIDKVAMTIENSERAKQVFKLREKVLRAEKQNENGETLPLNKVMQEIRKNLLD